MSISAGQHYLKSRQCEFGKAILQKMLEANAETFLRYTGVLRPEQAGDVKNHMSQAVYAHWDESTVAPPKRRPRPEGSDEPTVSLELLAWQDKQPVWPPDLDSKFPPGSEQSEILKDLKAKFQAEFPQAAPIQRRNSSSSATGERRVHGVCDYTADGPPADVQRAVNPAVVPVADFSETPQLGCH